MERGLIANPNRRSFFRFTTRAVAFPIVNGVGTIHGTELGSILMVNSAYGLKMNTTTFATNGSLQEVKEPVGWSPDWSIKGNQHHTRIRPLLLMGTKQADVVQSAAGAATQTLVAVVLGASYDTGWRGASLTSATNVGATTTYVPGVDYEFDPITGIFHAIDGGAIAAGSNVVLTANVPALTREHYTVGDNLNQQVLLKCFGIRAGDTYLSEEWVFNGALYVENPGDWDPTKDREWNVKFSANGTPDYYALKT